MTIIEIFQGNIMRKSLIMNKSLFFMKFSPFLFLESLRQVIDDKNNISFNITRNIKQISRFLVQIY